MAGFAAASLAIRSCFVDTLSGFKAPSVFLKSDSVLRCSASLGWVRASRAPQRRQYYQSAKTSGADDGVTYDFRFPRCHFSPPRSLPCGGGLRRARSRSSRGTTGYLKSLVHRISQVPAEPIPYLCPALGSRPVCTGLTFSARAVQSPLQQQQRHQRRKLYRDSITRL